MPSLLENVRSTLARRLAPPDGTPGEELLRPLPSIIGLDQLLEYLRATLAELLDVSSVSILLHEPLTGRFTCRRGGGADPEQSGRLHFHENDRMIQWLRANGTPLDLTSREEILLSFPAGERDLLTAAGISLVVPLPGVNRLCGLVLAPGKMNGAPFTRGELVSLVRVSARAGLAVEHALILERQESQLKKLLQADKLATVGQLAAGAAHEIRTPLATIRSGVEYLGRHIRGEEQYLVTTVLDEVARIDGIIKGLLALSRSTGVNPARLDLHDLSVQVLAILDPELRKGRIEAALVVELADTHVEADASQMKQVLLNVLLNAIQAMPDGGVLRVILTESRGHGGEENVLIRITDNGTGITPDDLPRVFDPFFTTRESGTGLGLSICYGIVARHGGDITIDSRTEGELRGTTVSIYLPVGTEAPRSPIVSRSTQRQKNGFSNA